MNDDGMLFSMQVQLPPLFNMPKSQLQCYAEPVYCVGLDMLSMCTKAESALERFASVVAWSISTTRPLIFGVAPFNPVLGETHHVSRGTLNVLLEQVCAVFCSIGTLSSCFTQNKGRKQEEQKNRKEFFFFFVELKMNNMQLTGNLNKKIELDINRITTSSKPGLLLLLLQVNELLFFVFAGFSSPTGICPSCD